MLVIISFDEALENIPITSWWFRYLNIPLCNSTLHLILRNILLAEDLYETW